MRRAECIAIITVGLSLLACGSYGGICDEAGACSGSNDLDIEVCIERFEAEEEVAELYGCEAQWEAYVACAETSGACEDGVWVLDCEDQREEYDDCTG